jgi:hypothetical protein
MTDAPHDHDSDRSTQTPTERRGGDRVLQVLIGAAIVVIGTNLLDGQIVPPPIRVVLDTALVELAAASLLLATMHAGRWYLSRSDHD